MASTLSIRRITMNGREPLYLEPGLDVADLFREFNGRDPYYRHISSRAVAHLRMTAGIISEALVIMDRNGGLARALEAVARRTTIVEHRSPFLDYLNDEFAASDNVVVTAAPRVEKIADTIGLLPETF